LNSVLVGSLASITEYFPLEPHMRTHQEIDARSLALHRLVAEKIRHNPQLFQNIIDTLMHWRSTVDSASQPYLAEWDRLVALGMDSCLSASVEDSQQANALRQCSPFCGVLTARERFCFLKEWRLAHATQ
jgi:hypothetical protein